MLESTQVARSGLERGLAELEALGLIRPSHVLPAEYLRALTTEGVLDAATADQVAAAYNRVRYSAAADDDPEVCEAVEALESGRRAPGRHEPVQIGSKSRRTFASGFNCCLPRHSLSVTPSPWAAMQNRSCTIAAASSRRRRNRIAHATVENAVGSADLSDPLDPFVPNRLPPLANVRCGRGFRSNWSAVVALVTFFGGYFFRDGVNKTVEVGDDGASSSGPNQVSARDAWKNTGLWVDGIHFRADEEARSQRYGKARLAYELLLAYAPRNASAAQQPRLSLPDPRRTGDDQPQAGVGIDGASPGIHPPAGDPRHGR